MFCDKLRRRNARVPVGIRIQTEDAVFSVRARRKPELRGSVREIRFPGEHGCTRADLHMEEQPISEMDAQNTTVRQ